MLCRRKIGDVPEEPGSPWRMLVFFGLLTVIALGGFVLIREKDQARQTDAELMPWVAPKPRPAGRVAQPVVDEPAQRSLQEERDSIKRERAERAERVALEMKDIPITMYCTAEHADCQKARKWFADEGYELEEHDIDADGRRLRERDLLNPGKSVPTIQIGDTVLGGFSEKTVETTLRTLAEEWAD